MNTQVTATGLQVTAKSNSTYLLIDGVDNASTKTTSADTKAATFVIGGTNAETSAGAGDENTDKIVYPAYYSASATTMPGTADTGVNMTITANTWYTANNGNPDDPTDATKNITAIASANMKLYTCKYESWLTLSEDSEPYNGTIKITSSLVSGDAGTSVVVVLTQGATTETIKLTNGTQVTTSNNYNLTSSTSVHVEYYVYIDGTTTNVYSDYINAPHTLTGELSVLFDIA